METAGLNRMRQVAEKRRQGHHAAELLQRAIQLVGNELVQVRQMLPELVGEYPRSASDSAMQLIGSGGKALRPMLTLIAARAGGGKASDAITLAAAAELVHDATLLHDDVIDDGELRRGRPTARVIWGNTVSVLSGDLLFIRALRLIEETGLSRVLREAMETVSLLVEGEVIQFEQRGRFDLLEEDYDAVARRKTASLFRWCARAGSQSAGASDEIVDALGVFGHHMGIAFQIRDDILDLTADPAKLGKGLTADLKDGKMTLPILLAMQRVPDLGADLERWMSEEPDPAGLADILESINRCGALGGARERMHSELQQATAALSVLPDGEEVEVLLTIARAIGARDH